MAEPFAGALERYLGEILHVRIQVRPSNAADRLPTFLARIYSFCEASIAGHTCIFLAAAELPARPSDIAKHIALVHSKIDGIIVFAASSLSAHKRSRLIAQAIPFVVPGNQLYIPELAIDLREHFRALRLHSPDGLSPAAQAVLFRHLLHVHEHETTPSAIAERLLYSAMSIGRAFDDLESAGLARTEKRGKERHLFFTADRRALLEKALPLLHSPVRSVKFLQGYHFPPTLKLAGESALAELTHLSKPRLQTYAVAASGWKGIAATFSLTEVSEYEAEFAVETWSYDPAGLSDQRVVDPLSLYAQFRNNRDERVAMAAEELLEMVPW